MCWSFLRGRTGSYINANIHIILYYTNWQLQTHLHQVIEKIYFTNPLNSVGELCEDFRQFEAFRDIKHYTIKTENLYRLIKLVYSHTTANIKFMNRPSFNIKKSVSPLSSKLFTYKQGDKHLTKFLRMTVLFAPTSRKRLQMLQ